MIVHLSREQIQAAADRAQARSEGKTKVEEFIEVALTEQEIDLEIDKLAAMPVGVYESSRVQAAKVLKMRASVLDRLVEAKRTERRDSAVLEALYDHWKVEPWPEPVDTDALLNSIIGRIHRHVVCSPDNALASALWVSFSWVHESATFSPLLVVTSALPMSGKTTLLGILSFMCPRSISTVEISEAALYRTIDKYRPTFVLDEFDDVLANSDRTALRSVINSGHTRGQGILRINKDKENALETFSTFGPKAIGMVERKLPAATMTRCIFIELKRRKHSETIDKFRHADDAGLIELRSKLCRWAQDNAAALRSADPSMPLEFENRYGDNWCMQFAIADLAGEEWGEKARAAAVTIERTSDSTTARVRVLKATKDIIEQQPKADAVASQRLVEDLIALPESEWADWHKGKPLTQKGLANLLKPFHIFPQKVWVSDHQVRGYLCAHFDDAWERYL